MIPVYNEAATVSKMINRVVDLDLGEISKEIIVVDDGSQDRTAEVVKSATWPVRAIIHERNFGKGRAIRTAIEAANGEYFIVQDADLELDPADIVKLVNCAAQKGAAVVYGARDLKVLSRSRGGKFFLYGNNFLNFCINLLFGGKLSDFNTCYKLIKTDLLRGLRLQANGFEIEAEISSKLLKNRIPILEVPVSYFPRTAKEGKKIKFPDAFKYLWTMVKVRWFFK